MKLALTVLGLLFIIAAVIYFAMPADQLPGFFPGHDAGLHRLRVKHGIVSAALGLILLVTGRYIGRR